MSSAGARYTFWWEHAAGGSGGTIPLPQLQLSDFVRAGRGSIEILALFEAVRSGNDIYDGPNSEGSIADAASDLMLDQQNTAVNRVAAPSNQLILFQTGGNAWSGGFEGTGLYTQAIVYVQTLFGLITLPVATTLDDAGFSFCRFNVPTGQRAILNEIVTGDRFILAVAIPSVNSLLWQTDRLLWNSDELQWAA